MLWLTSEIPQCLKSKEESRIMFGKINHLTSWRWEKKQQGKELKSRAPGALGYLLSHRESSDDVFN